MTAAPSVALVVNPSAGKGRAAKQVAAVAGRIRESGASVSILVGVDAEDALTVARKAVADGVDALVALGGDGMVHLALNAVAGTDTPLGIVPAGTGNDLASTLKLPTKDPVAAAGVVSDRLRDGAAWPMDAILVGDKWFGCVLGAGFDSRVNDRANRMSWPKGRMRYNIAMVAELGVFAPLPFDLVIDGEQIHTDAMLVAVGNAKSYGAGMQVLPDADVTDGLLDVMVLGPVTKPEFLKTFPKVFKGTHKSHPAVTMRRAKVIELSSPGVTAYADGEYLADLPIRCECVAGAVRVLA
ncbi:MAG TPA: diacylglycerol kinase [Mycobacteriales bacterium]|nr:diacylglycerol kinase [Mycobacteriales bacterium]